MDRRLEAFLSFEAPEVFHPIEHRHEVWKDDPFDVESIHTDARDVFKRLLIRATTPPGPTPGRILLLLGDSGCGKTHLVRAFRNLAHGDGLGFVAYMAMTSDARDYGNYVLANLIESLDWPYYELKDDTTGLMRLSRALASHLPDADRARIRSDEELGQDALDELVFGGADALRRRPGWETLDLGLVRALLYLQREDPRVKACVLSYLRCEDLAPADRRVLGGIAPRVTEDAPRNLVRDIGSLVWKVAGQSLIVCVDQLEDMMNLDAPDERFRRALATVCGLADSTPSSLFVVCCLRDYYHAKRAVLTKSIIDRLELDPVPLHLASGHSPDEIEKLVGRRLAHLYSEMDAPAEPTTYPIPAAFLARLARMRTRDVIEHCRKYREQGLAAGVLPPADVDVETTVPTPIPQHVPMVVDLEKEWNDFRAELRGALPEGEDELAALLAWATGAASDEVTTGHRFRARARGRFVEVDVLQGETVEEQLFLAVGEKRAQGGALARQIDEARAQASDRRLVLVRSTEYPKSPSSAVAEKIAQAIRAGGRRVVLEDSDKRTILALRAFRDRHAGHPMLPSWLAAETPLTRTPGLREILGLEARKRVPTRPPTVPPPPPPSPAAPRAEGDLLLGVRDGIDPSPLLLHAPTLRHAAFLGATGSGKTTLAMNVVEQLLVRGVPVIAVDRKGDLSRYADPTAWSEPIADRNLLARRDELRRRVDVRLYTPGRPDGRPLSISILPEGVASLPALEQETEVEQSAAALASMLGYKDSARDRSIRAVLQTALRLLAPHSAKVTLDRLAGFIHDEDPSLVAAVGRLDTKIFRRLVNDLETLKLSSSRLLGSGEPLDAAALLTGPRTPFSIISTKFLPDLDTIRFWVAQLLLRLSRHLGRSPHGSLQGVLLLDEADLYLPADSRPPTKAPLEGLLKRARSAGFGVFLATQSPGDLDYRSRDNILCWFIGLVKEPTAQAKMRPMLSDARFDVAGRLASRKTGQFFLVREGDVQSFTAQRAAIRLVQLADPAIAGLAARYKG